VIQERRRDLTQKIIDFCTANGPFSLRAAKNVNLGGYKEEPWIA
jgi:hypothetical protein